ncbi:MAG: hypothetical protein ROY99_07070 [Ignavibacterium sp.]|jgi:hypothetical protein|nr:hypothetical protein [Ignavibacterium sp.]
MQLIEIIQLIFLGFTVISLVILVTTYFTYRRRKQLVHTKKQISSEDVSKEITKASKDSVLIKKSIETDDSFSPDKSLTREPTIAEKKKNKFEIFKPASNNYPHTQTKISDKKQPPKTK